MSVSRIADSEIKVCLISEPLIYAQYLFDLYQLLGKTIQFGSDFECEIGKVDPIKVKFITQFNTSSLEEMAAKAVESDFVIGLGLNEVQFEKLKSLYSTEFNLNSTEEMDKKFRLVNSVKEVFDETQNYITTKAEEDNALYSDLLKRQEKALAEQATFRGKQVESNLTTKISLPFFKGKNISEGLKQEDRDEHIPNKTSEKKSTL